MGKSITIREEKSRLGGKYRYTFSDVVGGRIKHDKKTGVSTYLSFDDGEEIIIDDKQEQNLLSGKTIDGKRVELRLREVSYREKKERHSRPHNNSMKRRKERKTKSSGVDLGAGVVRTRRGQHIRMI